MGELQEKEVVTTYSRIGCIGTGFSGIGVGASLYRWYGVTDIQFFDRRESAGGTWFANTYPGKASTSSTEGGPGELILCFRLRMRRPVSSVLVQLRAKPQLDQAFAGTKRAQAILGFRRQQVQTARPDAFQC